VATLSEPKEIVLDLAEIVKSEQISNELVDFGVVGPGPRRCLNFINNRRWSLHLREVTFLFYLLPCNYSLCSFLVSLRRRFENEKDRSPACEAMYVEELRGFRTYLQEHAVVDDLRNLNLLGVQDFFSVVHRPCPPAILHHGL